MKYTIVRDLQFYQPTTNDMYALVTLTKGTEVNILNKRQVKRLTHLEQDAIKRMRKRERNTLAFYVGGPAQNSHQRKRSNPNSSKRPIIISTGVSQWKRLN